MLRALMEKVENILKYQEKKVQDKQNRTSQNYGTITKL